MSRISGLIRSPEPIEYTRRNIFPSISDGNMMLMFPQEASSPQVAREFGRIMGLIWLFFSLLSSVGITFFYGYLFLWTGVPSESILSGFLMMIVLNFLNLLAFIIGMQTLYHQTSLTKIFITGYNAFLIIILLFAFAVTILFINDAPKDDMVEFLSSHKIGASTFVAYMEKTFNCCGLISESLQATYYYQHQNHQNDSEEVINFANEGCHEQSKINQKGCLDNVNGLHELMKTNKDANSMYFCQQFLPVLIIAGLIILIMLFNTYVSDVKAAETFEDDRDMKNMRFRPTHKFSFGTCGFARQAGVSLPLSMINNPAPKISIISNIYLNRSA